MFLYLHVMYIINICISMQINANKLKKVPQAKL
jgi:hypothetical protein